MLRATFLLIAFTLVLGWTAFRYGGVLPLDWQYALLALGVMLLAGYLPLSRAAEPVPADWPLYAVALVLPLWAALQLLPLPLELLSHLSPQRASITRALSTVGSAVAGAPLSLRPEATRLELWKLLGYTAAFLIARDLMWRFPRGQWRIAAPLLVAGTLEAAIGLIQAAADPADAIATGTFVNRDHFSALLEITAPFAVAGCLEYWFRVRRRPFLALLLGAAAVLMIVAIAASLSRGGFLIAIICLAVVAGVHIRRHFGGLRLLVAAGVVFTVFTTLIGALASPRLLERFASHEGPVLNLDNRIGFWRETLQVAAAYPLTGCGFGAFASGVARFRQAVPTRTLDYAHNDALQLLAEGGIIGLLIAVAGVSLLIRRLAQSWPRGLRRAELPLACGLALASALAHSLFDFNLHIPACALAFAWVAGMCAGLRFSPPLPTHQPRLSTRELVAQFRR